MTRKKSGSKKKSSGANGKAPTAPVAQAASTPTASAAPTLALSVVAPSPFWGAVREDDCPAELDVDLEKSPTPQSAPGAIAATAVPDLLKWFATGVSATDAGSARLEFAASLSKDERAAVHSAIAAAGLSAALESCSEGVGEERKLTVYKKGAAPVKAPPSPELLERAAILYKWARDAGLTAYSRDEIAEQLAAAPDGAALAVPLASVWACRSAEQADVAALAKLVAADDAGGVTEFLKGKPGLVNTVDAATGQPPLHAACRLGAAAALRALVACGARLEDKDAHGRTALQVARTFEQCDAEAALLQLGVHDPEASRFPLNKAAAELGAKAAAVAGESKALAAAVTEEPKAEAVGEEPRTEKAVEESKATVEELECEEAQKLGEVEAAPEAVAETHKPAHEVSAAVEEPKAAELAPEKVVKEEAVVEPKPAEAETAPEAAVEELKQVAEVSKQEESVADAPKPEEAEAPKPAEEPMPEEAEAPKPAEEPMPAEVEIPKDLDAEEAPVDAVDSPRPAAAAAAVAPPEAPVTPDADAKAPPQSATTTEEAATAPAVTETTATAVEVPEVDTAATSGDGGAAKSPACLTPVTSVSLPLVAEAAASAAVAAADRVMVNVRNMVSEGSAWVSGHGGLGLYAGATALVAGLGMALLAVSRRR